MRDIYRVVGFFLVAIVGVLGVLAAVHMVMSLPFTATEHDKRAEWVGALGTVGTLIGTIWLATSAERRRHREAMDRAIIAASALQLDLFAMVHALQNALTTFFDRMEDGDTIHYKLIAENILGSGTWRDEQFLPLVVMRNHVAARLVVANSIIKSAVKAMQSAEETQGYSWAQELKPKTDAAILGNLIRSRDIVAYGLAECELLTATHKIF
jgi:hypothetical protein